MKLFLQAAHDAIVIDHHITVTVESVDGDEVLLSIDGPPWMQIDAESDNEAESNTNTSKNASVENTCKVPDFVRR